jgi:hypothetical protein
VTIQLSTLAAQQSATHVPRKVEIVTPEPTVGSYLIEALAALALAQLPRITQPRARGLAAWSGSDRTEDESALEIERSALSLGGRALARHLLDAVRMIGVVSELALHTDDGGLTLEFSNGDSGREIMFAIPQDASRLFFLTREQNHVGEAGLVVEDDAVGALAAWLLGMGSFPSRGVELG